MTLRTAGGLAALTCAATYLAGFALLLTVLAPLGYGTDEIDAAAVVAFIAETPGLLIAWNTIIYIVNALALVVLVVALHARLTTTAPGMAAVSRAFGTIWATLVLGAGMIANIAVERAYALASDPVAAEALWRTLHAVELGLGGGNEIAGAAWIVVVNVAARVGRAMARSTTIMGIVTGTAGLATLVPVVGEPMGAIFGLGAIVWFVAVGAEFVCSGRIGRSNEISA